MSFGVSNFTSGSSLAIFGRGLMTGLSGTRSGRGMTSVTVYFAHVLMRSGQIKWIHNSIITMIAQPV